jgi:hypothetical protein
MTQNNHWAIYTTGLSMKSVFIQDLLKGKAPELLSEFKEKRGVLFSTIL